MFNLENKLRLIKILSKGIFYIFLIYLLWIPYDEIRTFILSYWITNAFIFSFKILLEGLSKSKFQKFLDRFANRICIGIAIVFLYLLCVCMLIRGIFNESIF